MRNELDPRIEQWYAHLDKGQRFFVIDIDEEENTVEIQHFDGDIEELSMEEWRDLQIELSEEPENWAGALDIAEKDDLGTGVTDTTPADWTEPGEDYRRPNK
jgi:5,10-methenyltetrahydromethanopterin hydrogenase